MKTKSLLASFALAILGTNAATAQINLTERVLGAIQNGVKGFTFSDEDAANLSKQAIEKLDKDNLVATASDPYSIRLEKIFGKHKNENGLVLNYKVYLVKEVNAFATADGSVRVYAGLMDMMDDNELLAVIGHEIGHVANHDSRDAIKAAYKKQAVLDAVGSQSEKIAVFTDGQLGQLANAMLDSKHSRKQESEADDFSYDFMKRNGYNVNAVASAFTILAKMSAGADANFLDKMMSSHPDPSDRAANAQKRAEADGLYSLYLKQVPKTATKPTVKSKKATKKTTKKKK